MRRVVIFDYAQGIVSIIPTERIMSHVVLGSLSKYQVCYTRVVHMICELEPIALPVTPLRFDLSFLHHVLELLLRFVPFSVPFADIYEHCLLLYHESINFLVGQKLFQYLFLSKLFGMLGVYPSEDVFNQYKDIRLLVTQPFENMLIRGYSVAQSDLRIWLLGCIHTHHHAKIFTTLSLYSEEGK